MHHFKETETQWTYRGPWAFYFVSQEIDIFDKLIGDNDPDKSIESLLIMLKLMPT